MPSILNEELKQCEVIIWKQKVRGSSSIAQIDLMETWVSYSL